MPAPENTRPTVMQTYKSCPFCGSHRVRLWDGVLRVYVMPVDAGKPGVERTFPPLSLPDLSGMKSD